MCIRDRDGGERRAYVPQPRDQDQIAHDVEDHTQHKSARQICLLYTSDAADERSSVDLGGRRIIKKKKKSNRRGHTRIYMKYRTEDKSYTHEQSKKVKYSKCATWNKSD